jgi:hypothetical protein
MSAFALGPALGAAELSFPGSRPRANAESPFRVATLEFPVTLIWLDMVNVSK